MELYLLNLSKKAGLLHDSAAQKIVTEQRIERIKKLKFEVDKKVLLYSELLLRKIAAYRFGISARDVEIAIDIFGKPYVIGLANFEFSISHTRTTIALAVDSFPIGVDVENAAISSEYLCVLNHLSQDEQIYITTGKDRILRFVEIWTKKEAYLKALGLGLKIGLSSFTVMNKEFFSFRQHDDFISVFTKRYDSYKNIRRTTVSEESINSYYTKIE